MSGATGPFGEAIISRISLMPETTALNLRNVERVL